MIMYKVSFICTLKNYLYLYLYLYVHIITWETSGTMRQEPLTISGEWGLFGVEGKQFSSQCLHFFYHVHLYFIVHKLQAPLSKVDIITPENEKKLFKKKPQVFIILPSVQIYFKP